MAAIVERVSYAWDAASYRANSSMQRALADDFLPRIGLRGDERVLDVGCGDGAVTALVAALLPHGAVVGVDRSPEMAALARREHPELDVRIADVAALPFREAFDVVVSFTALHWVAEADQPTALAAMRRALVPGGRLALQFPGAGNAAALFATAHALLAEPAYRDAFAGFAFPWFFPTAARYRQLVAAAGLVPERVELVPRDVLHAGAAGLAGWITATWMPYTARLPVDRRAAFAEAVAERYAVAHPHAADDRLHVAGVRLEVEARRA
jgi:trans-aconitate methyltransferase